MFEQIPVFKSPEFLLFQISMRQHMQTAIDPMDATIGHVLPGALEAIRSTRSAVEASNNAAALNHTQQMSAISFVRTNMFSRDDAARVLAAGASAAGASALPSST
jgi:hypothetical protein